MFNSEWEYKIYYIKNFSTGVYKKQILDYSSGILRSKRKENKDDYTYLLYVTYLQLIENFLIFLLVLFHEDGVDNLYCKPTKLYSNIESLLGMYGIETEIEKDLIRKEKILSYLKYCTSDNEDEYVKLITESISDWYKHKNLLNSYKHWFRLESTWSKTVSMWQNNVNYRFGDYDSTIVYYFLNKDDKNLYRTSHSFNFEYIRLKSGFLLSTIENIRQNYLIAQWLLRKKHYKVFYAKPEKKVKYGSITFTDLAL